VIICCVSLFYGPGGRGIFDLTEITWTIDPIVSIVGNGAKISPVVPAMVAISTDPSIPSNEPVPPMIVPEKGGGRGGASNVTGSQSADETPPLFKTNPLPKLKTKAVPEYIYYILKFKKKYKTRQR